MTGTILRSICPNLFTDRAEVLSALMNELFPKYELNTVDRIRMFIAQVAHESGEFSIKTENMNYTTPQVIVNTWKTRFNLDGSGGKLNANDYIRNPQKLANEVYANRMGNGNQASGDGYRYRGGGFLQGTGKETYIKYAKYIKHTVEEASELVHTTDRYAMDFALWEFCININVFPICDGPEMVGGLTKIERATKKINGGYNGLQERIKFYTKTKKYII